MMANEITVVELTNSTGFPRRYTVASGTAIDKGSLLLLNDDRTATAPTFTIKSGPCAGIAAMDKSATDFSTSITAWTDGIFRFIASGAIARGESVIPGIVDNSVTASAVASITEASGATIIGYAMEDIADAGTGSIRVRI